LLEAIPPTEWPLFFAAPLDPGAALPVEWFQGGAMGMAEVQVKLFATLARYGPAAQHGRSFALPLAEGQDVRAVVAPLGLPDAAVRHIFVNGRRVALDYRPQPGDEVAIFPPLAGG
jgi:molybdopterin converting factor small subunit